MASAFEHDTLPAGTRLGEFEILQVLGTGGFGIVYLAMDHALERQVAIKEYMPTALAGRDAANRVTVRSKAQAETFALGLKSFINEARLLARFDHPALVKVHRFWEEQGTAYMVMPYYKGRTLQDVRREMTSPPDESWLRQVIGPILGALDQLHREQIYHRDVAPDNILLLEDEQGTGPRPVLLDLGAARRVIGDRTQTLTAILKPSFAPIEQYAETVQLRQGAWTDLYALAAVVHFCITGRPPVPASARAVHDDMPSLAQLREGLASGFDRTYSDSFVQAIDHALAVRPQDRPESVAAWRQELAGIVFAPSSAGAGAAVSVQQTILVRPEHGEKPPGHEAIEAQAYLTTIPAHRVPATGAKLADHLPPAAKLNQVPAAAPAPDVAPQPADGPGVRGMGDRRWLWVAVLALLVLMAGWWWHQHRAASALRVAEPLPGAASAVASAASTTADAKASAPAAKRAAAPQRPASAADKPAQRSALSPRQACGDRNFISMAICMKRHCVRPEYEGHPECKRMREQEEANRNRL